MSWSHTSSQTLLSPKHVPNFSAVRKEEYSLDSAFQSITSSLESLDFNTFFQKFDLDSPLCQYMERFSPSNLHALITKASATTKGLAYDSPAARAVRKAKRALDDELGYLDAVFKDMEAAGFHVGNVRPSLRWLRDLNRRSLERIKSSQKDHDMVSENNGMPLELRFPAAIPNSPIPLLSWQQQRQRYRDAQSALTGTPPRPPHVDCFAQVYPPPSPQQTGSHNSSVSHSAHSIHVRSPTRVRFPPQGHSVEQEEPDVPFIPPPPSPSLAAPHNEAFKGKKTPAAFFVYR